MTTPELCPTDIGNLMMLTSALSQCKNLEQVKIIQKKMEEILERNDCVKQNNGS